MLRNNKNNINSVKSSLDRSTQMLDTLFEISSDFNGILPENEILRRLAIHLMGQFALNNFAFYEQNQDENYSLIKEVNLSNIARNINISLLNFENNYIKCDGTNNYKLLLNNSNAEFIIKLTQNKGLLIIGRRMLVKNEFSEQEINFIFSIGNLALIARENQKLILEAQKQKLLELELNTAMKIQQGLLPKSSLSLENYEIVGMTKPAKIVGGDYYDFIKIDKNRYLIVIADVCGKSISAALIMANLQSALKTLLLFVNDLKQIIVHLNKIIFENTETEVFITCFIGILDISSNEFIYINAGHNPPVFISQSHDFSMLTHGGIILGFLHPVPFEYEQNIVKLNKNDFIFMYTDGLTEAIGRNNEFLGEQHLIDFLKNNTNLPAHQLMQSTHNAILQYHFDQHDDITALIIKHI